VDGERGVSPGAAEDKFASQQDAGDRVIHMPRNGPVVDEEAVDHIAQPLQSLAFVRTDRLVRAISAGGDHGEAQLPEEDVMERGVREHHAKIRIVWGHLGGD
jgi:hypothetical protein